MEKISKFLEIMQSIDKYLAWKVLIPCFFISTAVTLSFRFFTVRIILEPMYTTIRIIATLTCLVSFFGLIYKVLSELCISYYTKLKAQHDTSKKQAQIREQIRHLSTPEQKVFDYVYNSSCGVWVGETDAAVQTLIYKGLLERIGDKNCFADWPPDTDERALCVLTVIPSEIRNAL